MMDAISISEIETLRAIVFKKDWSHLDIAEKKGIYDANEIELQAIHHCQVILHGIDSDLTQLEKKGYIHMFGHCYSLTPTELLINFEVGFNYAKCEQLLGVTRAMYFERGIRYEKIDCATYSVHGYKLPFAYGAYNGANMQYSPSDAKSGIYLKRGDEWLHMLEMEMTETIDQKHGFITNPPQITGIAREATQDEIRELKAKGVRLW